MTGFSSWKHQKRKYFLYICLSQVGANLPKHLSHNDTSSPPAQSSSNHLPPHPVARDVLGGSCFDIFSSKAEFMRLNRTCTKKCPESWSWSLLQLLLPPPWLWPGVLGVFWAALWNILVLKFFLQSRVHKVFWSVQRAGLGHFSNLFSLQGCSRNWPLEYSCSPAPCSSSNSSYNQHLLWKKKTDNRDPCQVQLLFQVQWK